MKWETFIELCEKHKLYPIEIIEMIYAFVDEKDEINNYLLKLMGDNDDI
jgi:hypothetical protein